MQKMIKELNKEQTQRFHDLLLACGFTLHVKENMNIFKLNDAIIVLPETVQLTHILAARKTLDWMDIMNERDFHHKMKFEQVGNKYYWI